MSNLPSWPGAAVVYSRAANIVDRLNAVEFQRQCKHKYKRFRFTPSVEADAIIAAMNRGDEEQLKALVALYPDLWELPK